MKNTIVLIILILFFQSLFSQIDNCSECDTKIYSERDIAHLTLLELNILRNEIFARHNAIFIDNRLTKYFINNYDWYKPERQIKNIKLNKVELQNIELVKRKEQDKLSLQKIVIRQLKKMKTALQNKIDINEIIGEVAKKEYKGFANNANAELKQILDKIDLDKVHWYNETGLYKVTTDDGFFINEKSLRIEGNRVTLYCIDSSNSEILEGEHKTFSYGSDYESINEYGSHYIFEIQNNKLILVRYWVSG